MPYTRKQLRNLTGLPDKTLRWVLDRLDIQPMDINRTFFGSPIYLYDEDALRTLHAYIFHQKSRKEERSKGKRCRGGCNRYLPPEQLNSQQICDSCRRKAWLKNEIHHHDPLLKPADFDIIAEIREYLNSFFS